MEWGGVLLLEIMVYLYDVRLNKPEVPMRSSDITDHGGLKCLAVKDATRVKISNR